jgi:hypothetical protein
VGPVGVGTIDETLVELVTVPEALTEDGATDDGEELTDIEDADVALYAYN